MSAASKRGTPPAVQQQSRATRLLETAPFDLEPRERDAAVAWLASILEERDAALRAVTRLVRDYAIALDEEGLRVTDDNLDAVNAITVGLRDRHGVPPSAADAARQLAQSRRMSS